MAGSRCALFWSVQGSSVPAGLRDKVAPQPALALTSVVGRWSIAFPEGLSLPELLKQNLLKSNLKTSEREKASLLIMALMENGKPFLAAGWNLGPSHCWAISAPLSKENIKDRF